MHNTSRTSSTFGQHRFTLKELLLVVVVVVVLVAMFVPDLPTARAREKPRRVNCAGNLKQLGLAILMYSGDYAGYFPNPFPNGGTGWYPLGSVVPVEHPSARTGSYDTWRSSGSSEYITSVGKVWACPSSDRSRSYETWSSYRYIGSGLKDDNATATLISLGYDLSGNHAHNAWVNALFIDGHVEGAKPGTKPELWGND